MTVHVEIPCSFCGKCRPEVRAVICGPAVYICDECVIQCCRILNQHGISIAEEIEEMGRFLAWRKETIEVLDDVVLLIRQARAYSEGYIEDVVITGSPSDRTISVERLVERMESLSVKLTEEDVMDNEKVEHIEKRLAALEAYVENMQRTLIPMIERMASAAEAAPSDARELEKRRDVQASVEWDRRFVPGGALELMKSRPDLGPKEAVALVRGILAELKSVIVPEEHPAVQRIERPEEGVAFGCKGTSTPERKVVASEAHVVISNVKFDGVQCVETPRGEDLHHVASYMCGVMEGNKEPIQFEFNGSWMLVQRGACPGEVVQLFFKVRG